MALSVGPAKSDGEFDEFVFDARWLQRVTVWLRGLPATPEASAAGWRLLGWPGKGIEGSPWERWEAGHMRVESPGAANAGVPWDFGSRFTSNGCSPRARSRGRLVGMADLSFLGTRMEALRARGLWREDDRGRSRREAVGRAAELGLDFVDASSNDYLGYSNHPSDVSRETPFRGGGEEPHLGAGASRLIHGTRTEHLVLESELAEWVHLDSALLFSSGYSANVGAISALAEPEDLIISDILNHASIIDGCRLSRAETRITPHLDATAIEAILQENRGKARAWVITESYFSMDGDSPDLARLRSVCTCYDAVLVVDEAHALGVFGPGGSGLCAAVHVKPDVMIGTFGKALGAHGAFVATTHIARDWLWNRARSFVYSTAVSPLLASGILRNLRRLRLDDGRRERLAAHVAWLRSELKEQGVPVLDHSHGPILPILFGSPDKAMRAAATLRDSGILVQAVRPPTVPENTSRIRLTIHAGLEQAQLERLARALIAACQQ